ncbi:MAG: hypothetical protein ACI4BG_00845, partial [Prevotella sp.]
HPLLGGRVFAFFAPLPDKNSRVGGAHPNHSDAARGRSWGDGEICQQPKTRPKKCVNAHWQRPKRKMGLRNGNKNKNSFSIPKQ